MGRLYFQKLPISLRSNKCPPQLKELIPFKDDLVDLVKNIKFRKIRNNFQMKLHEDLKKARSTKKKNIDFC